MFGLFKTRAEAEKFRYNRWSGNPKGTLYDPARCCEEVSDGGRMMTTHQCNKKPGHGPDGLYCKQHNPDDVVAKHKASSDRWNLDFNTKSELTEAQRSVIIAAKRWREAFSFEERKQNGLELEKELVWLAKAEKARAEYVESVKRK